MNKVKRFFSHFPVVLPVIHVEGLTQTLENASVAFSVGCEGIFLINHGGLQFHTLKNIHEKVRRVFSDKWIGINFLDLTPDVIFNLNGINEIQGIWTDNPLLSEKRKIQIEAEEVNGMIVQKKWNGLYFGSVAFKYQPPVRDLEKMTRLASDYMDVITTSGSATGSPPNIGKIITMKKAAGEKPLAIASGITPENVAQYIPFTDFFLVATGIGKNFFEIDPSLLNSLLNKVRK